MTIHGTVSQTQHSTRVTGSRDSRKTKHIVLFRLDSQPVRFVSVSQPVNLADGDKVAVLGKLRNSELRARAIKNFSTGSIAHEGIWRRWILAAILPIFGLFFSMIASVFVGLFFGEYSFIVVYSLFLLASVVLIYRAIVTGVAVAKLKAL